MFAITTGAKDTLERMSEKGMKALNKKTMRWQIIDKSATYKVVPVPGCEVLHMLFADKDLKTIAQSKNLIL